MYQQPQPGYPPQPGFVPYPGTAPPPPAYPGPPIMQQPGPSTGIFVIHQQHAFGPESQRMMCPHCHADISTHIETEPNNKTHIIGIILCATGLCVCLPCVYCNDSCLAKKHYCPACKQYLGQHDN